MGGSAPSLLIGSLLAVMIHNDEHQSSSATHTQLPAVAAEGKAATGFAGQSGGNESSAVCNFRWSLFACLCSRRVQACVRVLPPHFSN